MDTDKDRDKHDVTYTHGTWTQTKTETSMMSHTHMERGHRQRQRQACYQVQSEYRCNDDVKNCQQPCVWPLVGLTPENKGTTRGCHCPLSCAMLLHGVLYLYISAQFARSFTIDACCFTIEECCFTIEACHSQ